MNQAALELLIQLRDEASKGLDKVAEKGGFLSNAFSFATGGLIQKGIEGIAGAAGDLFGGMISEAKEAQAGMGQLDAVLASTGGKAGVTKEQVLALADSLSAAGGLSTATDDAVLSGQNMLLTFTNIGKDVFPQATQAMLDMATKMNNGAAPSAEQLKSQAIQLGKALQDPTKGITALSRAGVSFSDEQKKVIAAMVETGDVAGAQKLILAELENQFGGSALAAASTFEGRMSHLGAVFDNVKQSLGERLLPILEQVMTWIGSPEVIGVIQMLADFIGQNLTNAFNFVTLAVQTLQPIVQPLFDAFGSFFATLQSGGDIGAAFGTLFSGIGATIQNAWPLIMEALGGLLGSIIQFFVDNGPTILATLAGWGLALVQWVWDALPGLLGALGSLIVQVWDWIVANGPTILAQLAQWGMAFATWVWNDAIPALMGALGTLISEVWGWITANGPGILSTLGEWTGAFFNWVMTDVLPQLPGWLWNIVSAVWTFITENGPTILAKLAEWTGAFLNWVWEDVLPQLPGWLWNIVSAVWTFITENGPTILAKLAEWTTAFFNWVMNDVLPQVPGWLGNIASALWTWVTTTAGDLSSKLVNEWIPSLWNWITGPGGVIENLGSKLGEIANGIWTWITQTATDMATKALQIGINLFNGIMDGIAGLGQAIWDWIKGIAESVWNSIVSFFTGGGGTPPPPPPAGKARGGPVGAGVPYIVGERGPEMFIPGMSGTIVPNHMLAGGVSLSVGTINLYAQPGQDGRDLAEEFIEELMHRVGVKEAIRTGGGRR